MRRLAGHEPEIPEYEYIVVGSGAGGGTVAARLAEAGHSVLLLEAGGDPRKLEGADPASRHSSRMPADYDVPAFHAFASENEAMKWDFYVRHYEDLNEQKRDWKYREMGEGRLVDGVLYPRAGTLGGCTAHNAQILVYPFNSDWDYIAELTGDPSWRSEAMRRHFERLENCRYRPLRRWLSKLGINPSGHGWKGWLDTEKAVPMSALNEGNLFRTVSCYAEETLALSGNIFNTIQGFFKSWADPNDRRFADSGFSGVCYTPLSTRNHSRMGTRERILEALEKHPNFKVQVHALASRVLLDGNNRAIGVEYLEGERLYRAHSNPNIESGELQQVYASREVILAGGAFNSPQILMLSGIGPRTHLESFGIKVRVDLPGVGKNLQDRYEVAIVNRMGFSQWEFYKGATFAEGDPQFREWEKCRTGIYVSNGALLSVFKHSPVADGPPDLFCMALLSDFRGYYPGYSAGLPNKLNYLTWVVLKARTRNRAGEVKLRSADPRDTPAINFRYFDQGGGEDMEALIDGIRFVRKLSARLKKRNGMVEESPGDAVQSDDELKTFIRQNAWGHHASCTCAIGSRESGGVLSSDFRVHGIEGLRVVDASIFPRIPGTFIASAIYIVAEKAAEAILSAAQNRS
jgi:choline dehydrogenase